MKFSPLSWSEVKPNVQIEISKGRLRLLLSQACPLYVSSWGVEALAGVSTSFDLEFEEAVTIRVEGDCRAFIFQRDSTSLTQSGENFTNIDRMVNESGSVLEVRKAMREFQLQQRAALHQIRAERQALQFVKPAPAPAPEPAPEPAPKEEPKK